MLTVLTQNSRLRRNAGWVAPERRALAWAEWLL